jgi:histidinol dehydrogenase
MRRSSTVRYDAKSLAKAAPVVETFARLEQLDAHGKSLTIRL